MVENLDPHLHKKNHMVRLSADVFSKTKYCCERAMAVVNKIWTCFRRQNIVANVQWQY